MDYEILKKGLEELGAPSSDDICEKFCIYFDTLEETNKVMNLTAISGWEQVVNLHFLDCAALVKFMDFSGKSAIDIGSGAGFPGLPLKIVCPDMELLMADSLAKRVNFLNDTVEKLNLSGASAIHLRAEEGALKKEYRDSFDFALSRAVAKLSVLSELCLPYVKPGGYFIAMKSADSEDEINSGKNAIKTLGGKIKAVEEYIIPGTDILRRAVIIEKISPTPKGYPRRFAKISKDPL